MISYCARRYSVHNILGRYVYNACLYKYGCNIEGDGLFQKQFHGPLKKKKKFLGIIY